MEVPEPSLSTFKEPKIFLRRSSSDDGSGENASSPATINEISDSNLIHAIALPTESCNKLTIDYCKNSS